MENVYKTQGDLNVVEAIIQEADEGINNKNTNLNNSKLLQKGNSRSEIAAISSGSALASLLTIGSFCIPGINIIAGPLVLLTSIGISRKMKNKRQAEQKYMLFYEAISKQNAVIEALQKETNADKERIEYLESINETLKSVIKDLTNDIECYKNKKVTANEQL